MGTGAAVSGHTSIVRFSWGIVGSVIIRVFKYYGIFDQITDTISAEIPKNRFAETQLSWVNREFALEDLHIIDLDTGKITDIPSVKARFRVSASDQFECLIETEELLSTYTTIYRKQLTPAQQVLLLEKIANECKSMWSYSRALWIRHQSTFTKKKINHCAAECLELSLNIDSSPDDLKKFITEKYSPDRIGLLQRRLKAKIIVDKNTTKPHVIVIRKSSYAEISKNSEKKSEVHEEIKLLVFCWDDIPQLASDNFIKSEIRKLIELIKVQLKDFKQKQKHKAKSKIL